MADDYIIKGDPDTAPSVPMGNVDLESDVSGILPIINGGTGVDSIAAIKSLLHPIGTIIESATCDTMAKVIEAYGGTTWLQHSGYVLRGATSGVVANQATKTGGSDNATLVSHTHTFTGTAVNTGDNSVKHTHSTPNHTHNIKTASPNNTGSFSTSQVEFGKPTGTTYTNDNMFSSSGGGTSGDNSVAHKHSVTAKGTNSTEGSRATNANIPNYKSVYIWERTA